MISWTEHDSTLVRSARVSNDRMCGLLANPPRFLESVDGEVFSSHQMEAGALNVSQFAVGYFKGKWIAGRQDGFAYSSSDLQTWTTIPLGTTVNDCLWVESNDETCLISMTGVSTTGGITAYSHDGDTWTKVTHANARSGASQITWAQKRALFVSAHYQTGGVQTSPNGHVWTEVSAQVLFGVEYSPEHDLFTGGTDGSDLPAISNTVWSSSDLQSWTPHTVTNDGGLYRAPIWDHQSRLWVTIGSPSAKDQPARIYTSPDLQTWTLRFTSVIAPFFGPYLTTARRRGGGMFLGM